MIRLEEETLLSSPSCLALYPVWRKLTGRIGTALATIPLLHSWLQRSLAVPMRIDMEKHDAYDLVEFELRKSCIDRPSSLHCFVHLMVTIRLRI